MDETKQQEPTEERPGNKTWVLEFPSTTGKKDEPEIKTAADDEIFSQDYGDVTVDGNDELDASDEDHDVSSPPPREEAPREKPPEVGGKIDGDPFGRLLKEIAEEEDMILDLANPSDIQIYNDLKADQRVSRGMIQILESKPAIMPGGNRGFLYVVQLRIKRFQVRIVDSSSAIVASAKSDKAYARAETVQILNDLAKVSGNSNNTTQEQP